MFNVPVSDSIIVLCLEEGAINFEYVFPLDMLQDSVHASYLALQGSAIEISSSPKSYTL